LLPKLDLNHFNCLWFSSERHPNSNILNLKHSKTILFLSLKHKPPCKILDCQYFEIYTLKIMMLKVNLFRNRDKNGYFCHLFLTSGDAKLWNEVFMGTPICKCVTHSLTHSLRCRHLNGWNGNCAVRAWRHIKIETAYHQITQKQRTFVAIQYNKYLVSQNIYLFK